MNRLSRAGVLAENMLFATLDPTIRKVFLPKVNKVKVKTSNNKISNLSDNDNTNTNTNPKTLTTKAIEMENNEVDIYDDNNNDNNNNNVDESINDVLSTPSLTFSSVSSADTNTMNTKMMSEILENERNREFRHKLAEELDTPYQVSGKGFEIFLTDTVGFISKLPTDLIAAFR